ncbi:AraC family transcriptional regulator [Pseudomonas sp. GM80]|uniref:AraC family transcriptional regulator n=1 Tax=Pseudomonas sp. GM80 TaxID=1144339 RepID=UPI00026FC917|nr:AraC family transcriptional regulator [Pseudomonas sp. GM80]EJN21117.1 DNA-binding domain-containing protein, AraC-type [Pseudomonas sp. GM80]
MDPLSNVLSLIMTSDHCSMSLTLGGSWAFSFPERDGIYFSAILKGSCWLHVNGEQQPQQLLEGDCFLINHGKSFKLYTDTSKTVMNSDDHIRTFSSEEIRLNYGGDDTQLIGVRLGFSGAPSQLILSTLPSLVHMQGNENQTLIMRWSLERFSSELREKLPGRILISEYLVHIILAAVFRAHLATLDRLGIGWLYGLANRSICVSLRAIHENPSRRWTVQELAQLAAMSRSAFALRFKQVIGLAPMEYLTYWRMLLASDRLRKSEDSISTIAYSLGYESESAFSTAFKRVMSKSPRRYAREHTVLS